MVRGPTIISLGENSVGQEPLPPLMQDCSMRPQRAPRHSFQEGEFLFVKGRTVFPIRAVGKCDEGNELSVTAYSREAEDRLVMKAWQGLLFLASGPREIGCSGWQPSPRLSCPVSHLDPSAPNNWNHLQNQEDSTGCGVSS